eukprot:gene2387-2422_t
MLEQLQLQHVAVAANIDERSLETDVPLDEISACLATQKALAVSNLYADHIVLGSDQTLICDGRLYHKPSNRAEAALHLQDLSGRAHCLNASASLACNGRILFETTQIATLAMRALSPVFIDAYLDKMGDEVLFTVGGYQIEALGLHLFDTIEGDHFTILGCPILPHSRSPLIHNYWLKQFGLPGLYELAEVAPEALTDFIKSMPAQGYRGGNVTVPHKQAVLPLCDHLTARAREIGAVNTLWFENDELYGDNTDALGFAANLDEYAPDWRTARRAMVLGAGGASRAIIYALREAGLQNLIVVNRDEARARMLASLWTGSFQTIGWDSIADHLPDVDLLINTTSLGMAGQPALTLPWDKTKAGLIVHDIVYVPLETDLLKSAKEHHYQTVDGLGMLLHQAVPGFAHWFGQVPTVTPTLRQLIVDTIVSP